MWHYILKRILFAFPILVGINLITFALFFFVNKPNDIARVHLGNKYISDNAIEDWKTMHGYHHPLFYNKTQAGLEKFTKTIFFQKSVKLFIFEFGLSDNDRDIIQAINERYKPSLKLAVPILLLGLIINTSIALFMVFFRNGRIDLVGLFLCVCLISISALFYIIAGQYFLGKVLKWLPISGYVDGWFSIKFLLLPIFLGVLSSMGTDVRWYRAIFLEEMNKDYVRTAKSKGLSSFQILFIHILPNGAMPIITSIIAILPLLFMGSLILESFFGIPGLGSYTVDAIRAQDFAVVRSMVFLGSLFYIVGLLLTDIVYVMADPRVMIK